jgi:hypothetical protein
MLKPDLCTDRPMTYPVAPGTESHVTTTSLPLVA